MSKTLKAWLKFFVVMAVIIAVFHFLIWPLIGAKVVAAFEYILTRVLAVAIGIFTFWAIAAIGSIFRG